MSEERNNLPDFDLPGDDSPQTNDTPQEQDQTGVEEQQVADPNAQAIFDIYRDEGFITTEEFDGTFEGLKKTLVEETRNLEDAVFQSVVGAAPDFAKPLVELVLAKGNDLSQDELLEVFNAVQQPEFTEDNLPSEQFLQKYYTEELGWEADEVEDRIERLKDSEKLEKEAKNLFKKWSSGRQQMVQDKLEQTRAEKEQARIQQEQFTNSLNSILQESYQRPKAQKLYNEFYSGSFKNKMEHVLTNPKAIHQLIDFLSYYDGEKFNMDTYKEEAFSPSTGKVKKKVESYWASSGATSSKAVDKEPKPNKINLKDYKFTD